MTDGIKAAKRELRRAERQWRATRLTGHREIYTKQRGVVKTLVRAARKFHFRARIENCSNTSSFQCPMGFLASQRPHHSRLTYHVLHSRTDFACCSLKKSRASDKTSMLTLLNQKHSLPMMVLNSVFSSLSQKRRFVNSLLKYLHVRPHPYFSH